MRSLQWGMKTLSGRSEKQLHLTEVRRNVASVKVLFNGGPNLGRDQREVDTSPTKKVK